MEAFYPIDLKLHANYAGVATLLEFALITAPLHEPVNPHDQPKSTPAKKSCSSKESLPHPSRTALS